MNAADGGFQGQVETCAINTTDTFEGKNFPCQLLANRVNTNIVGLGQNVVSGFQGRQGTPDILFNQQSLVGNSQQILCFSKQPVSSGPVAGFKQLPGRVVNLPLLGGDQFALGRQLVFQCLNPLALLTAAVAVQIFEAVGALLQGLEALLYCLMIVPLLPAPEPKCYGGDQGHQGNQPYRPEFGALRRLFGNRCRQLSRCLSHGRPYLAFPDPPSPAPRCAATEAMMSLSARLSGMQICLNPALRACSATRSAGTINNLSYRLWLLFAHSAMRFCRVSPDRVTIASGANLPRNSLAC
eukprot:TRINITY_DN5062_c0_g8_i1.p1 TRINITY_DN5062_c0_g8~~TRINITY_DN5062_c0_g8_i1.p1  ORF type:complete len:297 (+),score=0.16 TRINITY_DN5062_c0_g8_i1:375-1265(+)